MECVRCGITDDEMPYVYNTVEHHHEAVCVCCQKTAPPGTYVPIVSHAA